MPETSIERFIGDQVRRLQLTGLMFDELHRTTGKGALALYGAVMHREASHRDLVEIVRAALIGGGTAPQEAATLVAVYIDPSPILPTLRLVLEILDAAFEGVEPDAPSAHFFEVEDEAASEAMATRVKSAVSKMLRREITPHVYRTPAGETVLELDEVA